MRIFYSPNSGAPMLLDQQERLSSLAEELRAMVAVRDSRTFAADTSGSPAPYDELLQGLRVRSVGKSPTTCYIADDR
jgi:hypothetical protein